jgi:hypothetical protein
MMGKLRSHPFQTRDESFESQFAAGRYNPSPEICFRPIGFDKPVVFSIGAGSEDSLYLYREGTGKDSPYILVSVNRRLQYCGVTVFQFSEREGKFMQTDDVFYQVDYDIAHVFGPRGLDLEPHNLARYVVPYFA